MKRRRTERESDDMAKFVTRVAKGMVRRAADGDLDALIALRDMADAIDQATRDAARALHDDFHQPYSWTEIGTALGITRQGARQRFADNAALSRNGDRDDPDQLTIDGAP